MKNEYAYIVAPTVSYILVQGYKFLTSRDKSLTMHNIMHSGGMPSGHATVVTSIATVIFLRQGVGSMFGLALTVWIITIYDAMMVRRSVGEQGQALLKLLHESRHAKGPLPRVSMGHTPLEVTVGIICGVAIGTFVAFFIT